MGEPFVMTDRSVRHGASHRGGAFIPDLDRSVRMIAPCPAPPTPPPATGSSTPPASSSTRAGSGRSGMAEIVAAAGCGKNVLYRHFPSKDDLVLAYLQRLAEQLDDSMDAAVAGLEKMPSAALVAVTREVADRVAARGFRGCPFRNYLREMRDPSDAPGPVRADRDPRPAPTGRRAGRRAGRGGAGRAGRPDLAGDRGDVRERAVRRPRRPPRPPRSVSCRSCSRPRRLFEDRRADDLRLARVMRSTRGRTSTSGILADDLGYSDLGCYGGEIRSPTSTGSPRTAYGWRSSTTPRGAARRARRC